MAAAVFWRGGENIYSRPPSNTHAHTCKTLKPHPSPYGFIMVVMIVIPGTLEINISKETDCIVETHDWPDVVSISHTVLLYKEPAMSMLGYHMHV